MSRGVRGGTFVDTPITFDNNIPSPKADVRFAGNDQLFAGIGSALLDGKTGADTLVGGPGSDLIFGGPGVDTLTGGDGADQFLFAGNPFADGTPTPAGKTGINVLNKPDILKDFTFGQDQFVFNGTDLGIQNLNFQQGLSSQISGDANAIVLLDSFPAAGAAARAIANNNNITSDAGVFVYFNTTLGLTRLVYSQDLGDGGPISVLANLDNQRGAAGVTNLASFAPTDFSLI